MEDKRPAAHTPNVLGHWHNLQEHLEDVAAKSQEYAAQFGAGELGKYAGLWHDLGKYQSKFQDYLEQCHAARETGTDNPPRGVAHAIHGARLAWEVCPILAPIIYGHHAGLPGIEMRQKFSEPELDKSYAEVMRRASQDLSHLKPTIELRSTLKNPPKDALSSELFIRILFSCLVDADYLDTEEHFESDKAKERGLRVSIRELQSVFEQEQKQFLENLQDRDTPVNRVRNEVYHACVKAAELEPGIFRLCVPTGGGKTRSSLAFALNHSVQHGLDRVIVAVPYTSIIEQTVGVYRKIFGDEAVLEHHSAACAVLSDPEDARKFAAQARLATQNWDAPLVVTTTVQLFESLFANRPSRCRKLHNIVGSVIVLDEVQTLPLGLLEPILSVLRELVRRYRVTVVLCTATQPALEGKSRYLEGFESELVRDIVQRDRAGQHFKDLSRVDYTLPTEAWSWEHLGQNVQSNAQALVVLNTRKDALSVLDVLGTESATFQSLETPEIAVQEALNYSEVLHLSTLLCGAHRRQVLDTVRNRLKNRQLCLLVSTQVVEAGVDLDFPVVYRALGPFDRIVQAAGRCNREGKMQHKGRVVIFQPEDGGSPRGEYRTAVAETQRILQREDLDLNDPTIFAEYFSILYQDELLDKQGIQPLRQKSNYPEVAKKFKLIPDDTTPVVIQYDDTVRDLLAKIRRRGLFSSDHRNLQPYLVNLRHHEFQQAAKMREEFAPGLWIWHGNYDPVRGIALGDNPIAYDPVDLIQ